MLASERRDYWWLMTSIDGAWVEPGAGDGQECLPDGSRDSRTWLTNWTELSFCETFFCLISPEFIIVLIEFFSIDSLLLIDWLLTTPYKESEDIRVVTKIMMKKVLGIAYALKAANLYWDKKSQKIKKIFYFSFNATLGPDARLMMIPHSVQILPKVKYIHYYIIVLSETLLSILTTDDI